MSSTEIKFFPKKTASTIACSAILLAVVPLIPGLKRFGGLSPRPLLSLARFPGKSPSRQETPATASPAETNTTAKTAEVKTHIAGQTQANSLEEQPAPDLYVPPGSLDSFYHALQKTARKETGARTLILHYGDSPVTADSITADARSQLQARFGNAGHGFLLVAQPWAWYGHRGVAVKGKGWKIEPATQNRARDGLHGLGGVSFTGGAGASSAVNLDDSQSRVEVYYLAQPDGGSFTLMSGQTQVGEVSTEGPQKAAGFASFPLPAQTHEVRLEVTSGPVRLFGYSFARDEPGVVYSSLGLNGAQVQAALRYFNAAHWTEQLQHQHPDLLIFNYGTNESVFPSYIDKQYPAELRQVLERIRSALPDTSILVMSPMDRGERDASGEIVTPPVLVKIVGIQKEVALSMGLAFFDTFTAMGGAGTMGKWYNSQPRLVSADFMHPLPAGAAKVGTLLASALTKSFDKFDAPSEKVDQTAATGSPKTGKTR